MKRYQILLLVTCFYMCKMNWKFYATNSASKYAATAQGLVDIIGWTSAVVTRRMKAPCRARYAMRILDTGDASLLAYAAAIAL